MDTSQLAETVIKQAAAAGADVELYVTDEKETNIEVDQGNVSKFSFAGSKGLGVRVMRDGRMGYAYTSDFSPASVQRCTAQALALAETVDADPYRRLPEPQPVSDEPLDNWDPAMSTLSAEEKIAFAT